MEADATSSRRFIAAQGHTDGRSQMAAHGQQDDAYLGRAMAHRFCLVAPGDTWSTKKIAEAVAIGGAIFAVLSLSDGAKNLVRTLNLVAMGGAAWVLFGSASYLFTYLSITGLPVSFDGAFTDGLVLFATEVALVRLARILSDTSTNSSSVAMVLVSKENSCKSERSLDRRACLRDSSATPPKDRRPESWGISSISSEIGIP
jgi:hypothetical protein